MHGHMNVKIVQPFCHSQWAEPSQVRQCLSTEVDMCQ